MALSRLSNDPVKYLWCFYCAMLLVLMSFQSARAESQQRTFLVGAGVHLWNASRPEIDQQLEIAAKAKFSMIRWDVPWKAVETSPGILKIPPNWDYIVDSANRKGIASLLILDYGNPLYGGGDKPIAKEAIEGFVRYARYLAQHFQGRVRYFEVWNEWDAGTGATTPGSPEDYIRLVTAVYPALKQVNPSLVVLGGGSSSITYSSILGVHVGYSSAREGFFESLLHLGLLKHVDGVSVHPYVFSLPGCMGTDAGFYEALSRIENAVRQADTSQTIPVFVTEVGWPVGVWNGNVITEARQSRYLANAVQLAYRERNTSAIFVYQLKDAMTDPSSKEDNFGLVGAEGRLKAAFKSVGQANRNITAKLPSSIRRMGCSR